MSVNATDAAVKLAEKNGLDLTGVAGTGADGRITKGDVEGLVKELELAETLDDVQPQVVIVAADGSETAVFADKVETAVDELPGGMDTAVVTVKPASEPETAVTLSFDGLEAQAQTLDAAEAFEVLSALVDEPETAVSEVLDTDTEETVDEQPPLFGHIVESAATLQELIALGSHATGEAERAAIRARAKELLQK